MLSDLGLRETESGGRWAVFAGIVIGFMLIEIAAILFGWLQRPNAPLKQNNGEN
jgi:hypothetical protein